MSKIEQRRVNVARVWIEDLAPFGSYGAVVAVGWLERGREHAVGTVAPEVFARLSDLLKDPWQPFAAAGPHPCDLCFHEPERRGANNVFIPGKGRVFVAPELILHYMNAHQYRPPDEFCEAVLSCPPMRSPEYRRALLAAGGASLLRSPPALG